MKLAHMFRVRLWLPMMLALVASMTSLVAQGAGRLTWQVTPSPFMLNFVDDTGPVTSQIDAATIGAGGRLSYKSGGTVTNNTGTSFHLTDLISQTPVADGMSYTVRTNEANRTANVVVTQTAQGVRVAVSFTGAGTGAVTTVWEALSAAADEHYLSGSSAAHVDLRGWIRAWRPGKEGNHVEEYCKNQAEVATPFYLSSGRYGFYANTVNVGRFSFPGANPTAPDGPNCANTPSVPSGTTAPQACPFNTAIKGDRVQICLRGARMTYDILAGAPSESTSSYYSIVGMPLLPPTVQYGLWKWRDVNTGQTQVVSDVASFVNAGIPITGVWIDNPWEIQPTTNNQWANGTACVSSGKFDPRRYPDPQGMIDNIHAQGVLFGLWTGSQVIGPGGTAVTGGGTCLDSGEWNANGWIVRGTPYIDFTNPAAWQHWVDKYTPIFAMGVDMAKEDRGEEFQLESTSFFAGSGTEFYTQYPRYYHSAVTQALRNGRIARGLDPEGFVTFVRTAFTGDAQITHGLWASDNYHDFPALQAVLRLGISQSLTGGPASWVSDTGGIDPRSPQTNTNSPTKTVFVRWAQFSAVSSGYEVGGAGLNQDPVGSYDATTINRFRDTVVLHYQLIPYIYGLAREAATVGLPAMRGVGFHYPADQTAWAQDQEFMLGPNLLAAPVTATSAEADGAAGNPTNVPVYLPVGNWIDLYNGSKIVGPSSLVRSATLDEFPLYMRAGSAIGFNLRAPNVWNAAWGINNVLEANRAGWMYAPQQGEAEASSYYGTSTTAPSEATLDASTDGNTIRLALQHAPTEAQVLVLMATPPASVVINQATLPQAASLAALQAMPSGWIFKAAPFGGVLLKLATAGGAASAVITTAAPTAATTTVLGASVNPSVYGQSSTFTATVTAGAGVAGSVQFRIDGDDYGVPLALSSGRAQISVADLSAGMHSIVAIYSGDNANLGSTSAPLSQRVGISATSTQLGADGTAAIAPSAPGGGVPTGTVQFRNGASNVGAPVVLVGGQAMVPAGVLTPGPYTLTAVYSGDANFAASSTSAAVTLTGPVVNAGPDASAVRGTPFSSSGSFTQVGTSATWSATVDYGDGSGPQPLTLSGMNFSLSHAYASAGVYTVVVQVTDDTGHVGADTALVTSTYPSSGVASDVDGDGVITCTDMTIATSAIGKRTGQPGFYPTADVDNNGIVDVRDVSAIARKLAAGTRC